MKGIVWLMQEKWWLLNFSAKRAAIWWALSGGSLVKDWVQWPGCQNGVTAAEEGVFERPPEERDLSQGHSNFQIQGNLMGREGGLGSSEEWEDRTKSKEQSRRWKVGMLKGSAGKRQILNQHIFLQSKSQRTLGECVHSLLSPQDSQRRLP